MRTSSANRLISTVIFLALFIGTGYCFLKIFAPKPLPASLASYTAYSKDPMHKMLEATAVRTELDAFLACGSRYPGQPGFYKAADFIRKSFEKAGLTVLDYRQKLAVPMTAQREILGTDGKPLADVEIYPFVPNHMQPAVTPPEGLSGRLMLVSDEVLLKEHSFTDAIAVIDAANPPPSYGVSWIKYAQLGFKAVILANREGLSKIIWQDTTKNGMVASNPVNYVRLAATEGIFQHIGETVTLHVRMDWKNVDASTFVAYFPSEHPTSSEALVITSCYDACSMLPDLAPGTLAASGVALQLSFLKGITSYRETLKRDLVFVSYPSQMMGHQQANGLAALLGPAMTRTEGTTLLASQKAENDIAMGQVNACMESLSAPVVFDSADKLSAALAKLTADTRKFLDEQVRYAMNKLAFDLSEEPLRTRMAFLACGGRDLTSPEFKAFTTSKKIYDQATNATGFSLEKLVGEKSEICKTHDVVGRCLSRLSELQKFHEWRASQIRIGLEINSRLMAYNRLVFVDSYLAPGDPEKVKDEKASFLIGAGGEGANYRYSYTFNDLLTATYQRGKFPSGFKYDNLQNRWHDGWASSAMASLPVDTGVWKSFGFPAMSFFNSDRSDSYQRWGYPVELPYMRNTDTIRQSLLFAGDGLLALAHGEGAFEEPIKVAAGVYGGQVFVSNVGRSIVPNFPLSNALIGHKGNSGHFEYPGYYFFYFMFTDPYGRYSAPFAVTSICPWGLAYSPEAVGFDSDGRISYIKDEGPAGQAIYKSTKLGYFSGRDHINIVVFRASPVTLLDMVNPQTLNAFSGVDFLSREGLSTLTRNNIFPPSANGIVTAFVEPGRPFFITLKSGAAENPLVLTTRGFMLNVDEKNPPSKDREIDGLGFLAYNTQFILQVPRGIASSVQQVNGRRLVLQEKYGMADERTKAFQKKGGELLVAAKSPELSGHQRHLMQSEAATYGVLNHPVLRKSIYEAVIGILWYLGLLVPFVFFFEKLVFGYADIRKQLTAQGVIFLTVFMLLWLLHPAFEMIRSSLMILLGFIVMLASGGVTLLFSGKFKENLTELRKKRGQVEEAEVNKFGVLGTAFSLGLNNMHRRKVRTGLTCATLVLITFAMICFTSIQSNVVNVSTAIGKASYQGLLVKPRRCEPISDSQLFALQTRYSHLYEMSPRRFYLGKRDSWRNSCRNPDISLTYEPEGATPKKLPVSSIMTFTSMDPIRNQIELLTKKGWLPKLPADFDPNAPAPVLISEETAQEMGVTPAQVDGTAPLIAKINGKQVVIYGIFRSDSLRRVRDLDDRDILPFDVEAVHTMQLYSPDQLLAEEDDPRQNPSRQVLALDGFTADITAAELRLVSIAVNMSGLSYKQAKAEIDRYLEQRGQETYFGLDGVAYYGKITRENSFAGLVEILIPLLIAAMTVLNTMRGSVYERRGEIFVYNAVGIAPRYIFAMFISEAVVYAVVGSVLGYLLSQGTGKILSTIGFTGGLNMTFTSVTTIYASLAIMVAVFISTFFPARSAMQIAAPADDAGWSLPKPDGDVMKFDLPFTFDFRDRVAVLAFFHRYLSDHGEGSSGPFFTGQPMTAISTELDPLADHGYVPEIRCTIWLKPFDLGVSQEMVISMPTDLETKEFIASISIRRLSGTRESWLRLNPAFVGQLRQNFLYWRAVSMDERAKLFDEARKLLQQDVMKQGAANV